MHLKKLVKLGILTSILGFGLIKFTGCKTGEGCDSQTKYSAQTDKDGNLSTKRGKSNLFSKKQRKKVRK